MKNLAYLIFALVILTGCQSMGEHFSCLDEANRITKTEQRFVRTETKCVEGRTAFGAPNGSVNCSTTPIYETVILNQSERDTTYKQCRNSLTSNRNSYSTDLQTKNSSTLSCNEHGEILCKQFNMKCVSSGATQWCTR